MVGRLTPLDPETGEEGAPLLIYSRREVEIGRKANCDIVLKDAHVSHVHLRIYTVLFDEEDPDDIVPLVYARNFSSNATRWNGYPMVRKTQACLLSDGDILSLPSLTMRYNSEHSDEECEFDSVRLKEMKIFEKEYKITKRILGSGGYGQVHMAYDKDGQQFACKIIDLQCAKAEIYSRMEKVQSIVWDEITHTPESAARLRQQIAMKVQEKLQPYICEADILKDLCHPNIIGIHQAFRSSNTIYLVQELAPAGDLFSFLQPKKKLDEADTRVIIRQVTIALDYLHDHNIIHRDLKPDNILMTSNSVPFSRIIITDFGCAKRVQSASGRMSTMVGTFDYSAPEIFRHNERGYTRAVDMWSLGCLTVTLLTGSKPVFASKKEGSAPLTMETNYKDVGKDLKDNVVSKRAYDFASKLLIADPGMRMTAKGALHHKWFTNRTIAGALEEVYQQVIEDWEPCTHMKPFIVDLGRVSTGGQPNNPRLLPAGAHDNAESFSAEPVDWQYSNRLSQAASSTLSDPMLPPYDRAGNIEADTVPAGPHLGSQYSAGSHTMESNMDVDEPSTISHAGRMPGSWVDYEESTLVYDPDDNASMGMDGDYRDTEDAYIEQDVREVIDNIRSSQHIPCW